MRDKRNRPRLIAARAVFLQIHLGAFLFKTLVKTFLVHHKTRVCAFANFFYIIPRFERKLNGGTFDVGDDGARADLAAHGRCGEMFDLDFDADGGLSWWQMRLNRIMRGGFHQRDQCGSSVRGNQRRIMARGG